MEKTSNGADTQQHQPPCDQPSGLFQVIPLSPDIMEYVPLRKPRAALNGVQHNLFAPMTQCTLSPASTSTPPTPASNTMTPEEQWESAMKKLRNYTKEEILLDRQWDEKTKERSQQQEAAGGRDEETVQQLMTGGEPLPIHVAPAAALPAAPAAALPAAPAAALPAAPAAALPAAPAAALPADEPVTVPPARRVNLERALARQQEIVRREHQDLICFRCQERGHVQRYCTSDSSGRYCYKCSAPGYDTMSCPYCARYQKRAVENMPEDTVPSLLELDFSHLTIVEDEEDNSLKCLNIEIIVKDFFVWFVTIHITFILAQTTTEITLVIRKQHSGIHDDQLQKQLQIHRNRRHWIDMNMEDIQDALPNADNVELQQRDELQVNNPQVEEIEEHEPPEIEKSTNYRSKTSCEM
ncbi:unnamed protein product [Trichogramma brassicae]|uniref:CCHC-type domain-containing protein n=1 Tax=Trichogramma brassicae TaxID=86971 RepID=A0A6H5I0U5_9HYME|nr:unnamed protein product [Trichogramma brassicae]